MKGMPGVVIAAALGIVGAFCNWFYVNNKAQNYESVSFVAIDADAEVNPGDRFREGHFVEVPVPKQFVGDLDKVAVPWEERESAVGFHATKSYYGGEVLFWRDLETPAQQDLTERLGNDEVLFQVVVDAATFVPEHYDPGDEVRFFVPQYLDAPVGSSPDGSSPPAAGTTKTIGPFRILALGGRKGKRGTASAYNQRTERENIITIALKFPFDAKANELLRLISISGGRGVRMIKHKSTDSSD